MLQPANVIQRIAELRSAARTRELSNEELREALSLMRQGRVGAAQASATSKAKKAPVDADALLGELANL